ncbi:amidohydrolase [Nocardioides coralli]|uniref:amidohydrolase n=1 Tax=Nocardioides coralli TaxID=2872154 RepID=UPI001CA40C04|nr:amidohydrolase [Nocardioides coralli]QZY29925.1 amidohydrolase [Nocardioides coralli]
MPTPTDASATIDAVVDKYADDLVELRRDLHTHPELSWAEHRTTEVIARRLTEAGIAVTRPTDTGLVAEVGAGDRLVALRADLDALPVDDTSDVPWASTTPGVAHACGHDVHTAGLLGSALALHELHHRGQLRGRVRLVFQPAEEVMPGGALQMMGTGVLDGVERIFMLHCDPSLDVGELGLRDGALTGAADAMSVRLSGRGGHTSRPHLTEDLTFALGKLVTELPAIVSRRMDPRAGVSIVWGMLRAGSAHNVVPGGGYAAGTVRMLDAVAWADAEALIRVLIDEIVAPYGVTAEVDYRRGVPPVVNDHDSTEVLTAAVRRVVGAAGHVSTTQSLGGEDFGWYLERVPGAMARLGTRTPGGPRYDLHQGNLVVDERATPLAAKVLAEAAHGALSHETTTER